MNRIFPLFPKLFISALALLLLAACFNRDNAPVYATSEEVPPIEVPEGLSQPRVADQFRIPGNTLPELGTVEDEMRPPRVQPSEEAERSRSQIRYGERGLYLEVEDQPESVWRRLGYALDRGHMSLNRRDESAHRYRFRFSPPPERVERRGLSRLAFWRGTEVIDYSGEFVVEIERHSDQLTRVVLLDRDGGVVSMDRAEYVLDQLRERLG